MNISEAKQQIKNAVRAYLTRDEFGGYRIPLEKQRPIFLMGPPGIGKTAIMEQIAGELGVGLVSYSMAHHTRQSALGLPFIVTKTYGGAEYQVSEYTMSEIIASVYDMMEETGVTEGILFLDEINCVSETLAPTMLQFLQYKIFGRHWVPEGWIVVTAGNPPAYNKSVREFDIVTWDRLKRIDVEPDLEAWKAYAYSAGVHGAVMTYLSIKQDDFYKVETTVEGKCFVTARGWEDLSRMMQVCEEQGIGIDEKLIAQYIQDPSISKDFAVYYDLYNKYRGSYQVEEILAGRASEAIRQRARDARFDERLSLIGLLLDAVNNETRACVRREAVMTRLLAVLKEVKEGTAPVVTRLAGKLEEEKARLAAGKQAASLTAEELYLTRSLLRILEEDMLLLSGAKKPDFSVLKADFDRRVAEMKSAAQETGSHLDNLFSFCDDVFPNGQELLILVTELTLSDHSARFIARYGCKAYFAHNKEMLFYERQQELLDKLDELEDTL